MKRMHITCNNCCGTGTEIKWRFFTKDISTGIGTMQREEIVCESCNGKGYTEYAVFSIEEAEAILKHCGLNKE